MSNYITIGMDLGNSKHTVCAIDGAGEVLWRNEVAVLISTVVEIWPC